MFSFPVLFAVVLFVLLVAVAVHVVVIVVVVGGAKGLGGLPCGAILYVPPPPSNRQAYATSPSPS